MHYVPGLSLFLMSFCIACIKFFSRVRNANNSSGHVLRSGTFSASIFILPKNQHGHSWDWLCAMSKDLIWGHPMVLLLKRQLDIYQRHFPFTRISKIRSHRFRFSLEKGCSIGTKGTANFLHTPWLSLQTGLSQVTSQRCRGLQNRSKSASIVSCTSSNASAHIAGFLDSNLCMWGSNLQFLWLWRTKHSDSSGTTVLCCFPEEL